MSPDPQFPADLVTLTEEILNGKLHFLCIERMVSIFPQSVVSILVNNENKIFKMPRSVTKVFECKHKEADSRMIFYALQQQASVVVCSKDKNVLLLMVFAYALNKTNGMQVMKTESRQYKQENCRMSRI